MTGSPAWLVSTRASQAHRLTTDRLNMPTSGCTLYVPLARTLRFERDAPILSDPVCSVMHGRPRLRLVYAARLLTHRFVNQSRGFISNWLRTFQTDETSSAAVSRPSATSTWK